MLQAPARLHELDGQPVEQVGEFRAGGPQAEVGHGRDQRLAEMPGPDVVDRDAGRQGIAAVDDPSGQGEPAARADLRNKGRCSARRGRSSWPGGTRAGAACTRWSSGALARASALASAPSGRGQPARRLDERRGGLGPGVLERGVIPHRRPRARAVEGPLGRLGVATRLEDGSDSPRPGRQRRWAADAARAASAHDAEPRRLAPLILEPLDGQDREQGRSPRLGQGQAGLGDVAVLAGVIGRHAGRGPAARRPRPPRPGPSQSLGLARGRREVGLRLDVGRPCGGRAPSPPGRNAGGASSTAVRASATVRSASARASSMTNGRLSGQAAVRGKGTGAIRTSPPSTAGVAGPERTRRVGPRLLAADEQVRRPIEEVVERPRQARLGPVRLAGHAVDPDVIRLEEGAEAVVIDLGDRVELVVVAAGALDRQRRGTRGTCARPCWPARRCG